MAGIAIPLANILLGLGRIGTGIGFEVAEEEKIDELDSKSQQLTDDLTTAGNFYDHIYYSVAVNLDRVKKALDKMPSDMLDEVQSQITSDIADSEADEALETVASVLGYARTATLKIGKNLVKIVIYLRDSKAQAQEPSEAPPDPFENVSLDGQEPEVVPESESSFSATPELDTLVNGLNIAGVVFGAAGLAATIALGVWTVEKLDNAISDVEKKQVQVTAFQTAMKNALDPLVNYAGLPAESYGDLTTVASTWKIISENFDSYQKVMYYAILGYVVNKPFDDIKKMVEEEVDAGMPYPDEGYSIAKTLAEEIKYQIDQNQTDKEIVDFFATVNPEISLRFVFDEYFISTLRWM